MSTVHRITTTVVARIQRRRRGGSLRRRILVLTAVTAAGVAVLVAAATVGVAALILNRQVDNELRAAVANGSASGPTNGRPAPFPDRPGNRRDDDRTPLMVGQTMTRIITPSGSVQGSPEMQLIPVDSDDLAVARGASAEEHGSVKFAGRHYRTLTVPRSNGPGSVQAFRSTDDIDESLVVLGVVAASVAAAGVVMAGGLGWLAARSALRPVDAMASAAEHVAATDDLTIRVPEVGGVELEGLARSMNTMLASLASSQEQQQHLIADAGHELRTPITSIRTNLELIAAHPDMDEADRTAIFSDVTAQLEEFGVLIADLTALARGDDAASQERSAVRLDVVVERAVGRARRRSIGARIEMATEPATLDGQSALLERAVLNVLDNAIKWSPPDGQVTITQAGGVITVSDEGPGVSPEDRVRVFDRFWRPESSRSTPGSGLGLAIVEQVVRAHGGTAVIGETPAGGASVVLTLPVDSAPTDLS